jgi:6-phospho-beta-glucosidase
VKITVIGGGSTYTPELLNGFLTRINSLPVTELCLMDIDQERLKIVGGFAQRMISAHGNPFKLVFTTDQREAVQDAAYVITQLRVGKMEARRNDEYLGKRHGLIGQETTGVGGMAKALRSIPVILKLANDMRELAPEALLVNFTNPSGLISEALSQYAPDLLVAGLCNSPTNAKMMFLDILRKKTGKNIEPKQVELNTLGINHLIWHRGFSLDGEDVWPIVLDGFLEQIEVDPERIWDKSLIETLRMVPSYYLEYYYYTDRVLKEQLNWPPSRAEVVMKVEADLLSEYSDQNLIEPPADLMKRGGAYYSTAATQLINSHYNDLGETHVVNIPHKGAVKEMPKSWVLELPCRIDRAGIHPLPADPLPLVCSGLLMHVKSYELLAIEAAIHGDRNAAFQALLAHPLGPSADKVQDVLDDMLETNKAYLPQFWPETGRNL